MDILRHLKVTISKCGLAALSPFERVVASQNADEMAKKVRIEKDTNHFVTFINVCDEVLESMRRGSQTLLISDNAPLADLVCGAAAALEGYVENYTKWIANALSKLYLEGRIYPPQPHANFMQRVYREENEEADRLSKVGCFGGEEIYTWTMGLEHYGLMRRSTGC